MKIAFVGKGGSGKTTVSSLFCRYLASQRLPVLAIDADINQHLGNALGFPIGEEPLPLGLETNRIKEYLRGSNRRITSNESMIKTTPPGNGSRLLSLRENNPVFSYFKKSWQGVDLLATGPFSEEDLGTKCYHSKVGAVELLLNHLIDGHDEYVVVDMTAGADSFASGMFTKFDMTFLVAEPTVKALTVYDQYKEYAKDYGVNIKVIGNKVENQQDFDFIKQKVGNDLIGAISHSQYVKKMEKGQFLPFSNIESENKTILESMLAEVDKIEKDWERFYTYAVEFHIKNAKSWANASVGEDLTLQVDPEFKLIRS